MATMLRTAVGDLAKHIRNIRRRRAQRLALAMLVEIRPGRLDDLGFDIHDITEALHSRALAAPAARTLHAAPMPLRVSGSSRSAPDKVSQLDTAGDAALHFTC